MKITDMFEDKNLSLAGIGGVDRVIYHNPNPQSIIRMLNSGKSFRGLADNQNVFLGDANELLHLQMLSTLKANFGYFDDMKLVNLINILLLSPNMPSESGYGRPFILPNGSKLYTLNKRVEARNNRFLAALMKISELA